jgi:hypothetical protein
MNLKQWTVGAAAACVWAGTVGAQDLQALQKAVTDMQKQAAAGAAPVVDFRQMKALLPEKIGDLKRESAKGEKNSAMGFTVSEAEGKYRGEGDRSIEVKLADTAGMGGLAGFAQMGFAMEIDNESDTGYEKTYAYKGHRVLEKYDTESKSGEISALIANRFTVTINVQDGPPELLKAALDAIDLKKLAELKPAPKAE